MDPVLDARRVAEMWSAAMPRMPVDDSERLDGVGGVSHSKLLVASKGRLLHLTRRLKLRHGKIVAPQSVREVRASKQSVADEIAGV